MVISVPHRRVGEKTDPMQETGFRENPRLTLPEFSLCIDSTTFKQTTPRNEMRIEDQPSATKRTTKRDLVMRIAEETGLIQQDVQSVIQKTLDYITESLARGENVEFRNFGVFEVCERKSRIGRNPNRPDQVVTIPTRKVVKFKPGKIMKQEVTGDVNSTPVNE
jgi:nucleoid DNA-binding protein